MQSVPNNPYANPTNLIEKVNNTDNVLFLFAPRAFAPQARRSLTYNFDDRFVNDAYNTLSQSQMRGTSAATAIHRIMSSQHAASAVVPTGEGIVTRLDEFSDRWTFILVVNNERPKFETGPATLLQNARANRAIYIGICLDEPVNPMTVHLTNPTLNMNALLQVTHRTQIHQMGSYGPNGAGPARYSTVADVDIVNPQLVKNVTGGNQSLFRGTPDHLLKTTSGGWDEDGNMSFIDTDLDSAAIRPGQASYGINTIMSNPHSNLRTIISGISQSEETIIADRRLGAMSTSALPDNLGAAGNDDYWSETLRAHLQSAASTRIDMGLSETEIVTMETIKHRYAPETYPVTYDKATMYGSADQAPATARNAYSSMIMQAAPAILAQTGLTEISCQFDTHLDWHVINDVGPLASGSFDQSHQAGVSFMTAFRAQVIEPIKIIRGDFRLTLVLQAMGVSNCLLHFLDDPYDGEVFEVPSILGGFNTNMITNDVTRTHNAGNVATLKDMFCQTQRHTNHDTYQADPPKFQYDWT
jgi:hypothetical protein